MRLREAVSMLSLRRSSPRLVSYEDFRCLARRRLPRMIYDFVDGGADGEVTLRGNEAAFDRLQFAARSLVDVSRRDAGATVLGRRIEVPFICGPAGLARLVHRGGELEAARAAASAGTVFVVSTASSYSLEEIAAASSGGALWFQLYLWGKGDVVRALVDRAEAAGYEALVLTVDVPVVGKRERDLRNGMALPPRIGPAQAFDAARRVRWLWHFLRGPSLNFGSLVDLVPDSTGAASIAEYTNRELVDQTKTWDDLAWLRERWSGPLLVKGVMSVEDARRSVDGGADGVVVSNHGGRQLDGLPPALDVLGEVAAEVGGEAEVILDGGVRRGSDLVKARALGAAASMAARPWFFALACGGREGVERLLAILREDVDRTLALLGCADFGSLDSKVLR